VLGVIELVSAAGSSGFSDEEFALASGIADYAAIAIQNAQNFRRVQELTLVDEHTGLYNTRHLRGLLEREVERARRFRHPLSLLFLDLDRFKSVNDLHGHLVGSQLLREVGVVIREAIREVDSAFRYGGDEFAVLLPETTGRDARVVGERIRSRMQQRSFMAEKKLDIRLTSSIGSATYPDNAEDANGLIDAADRAMYRVKSEGRDGVRTASDLVRSAQ
jgi:diguanylate cyclase (GGDEF)-like protein